MSVVRREKIELEVVGRLPSQVHAVDRDPEPKAPLRNRRLVVEAGSRRAPGELRACLCGPLFQGNQHQYPILMA